MLVTDAKRARSESKSIDSAILFVTSTTAAGYPGKVPIMVPFGLVLEDLWGKSHLLFWELRIRITLSVFAFDYSFEQWSLRA